MCQLLVQMVHDPPKLRLSKLRIVVYPSSDLRVYLLGYLIHMPLHRLLCSFQDFIASFIFFTDFLLMAGVNAVNT